MFLGSTLGTHDPYPSAREQLFSMGVFYTLVTLFSVLLV